MKPEVRKYKMSDTELVLLAENLKRSAVRDLPDLQNKGVTADTLSRLQSAIYNFRSFPTDEELSQTWASHYSAAPVQYSSFFKKKIKHAENAVLYATDLKERAPLEELSLDGITPEMLDHLNCPPKARMQFMALQQRDIAVYDRIAAGNTLYGMMISLASMGKQHWFDLNENKYNDYSTAENYINNWQCTDGCVAPDEVVNISVTPVSEVTVFTLMNNGCKPLLFFFAGNPDQRDAGIKVELLPGESKSYTSLALGYDEEQMKTRLNVLNEHALPGKYLVEWV